MTKMQMSDSANERDAAITDVAWPANGVQPHEGRIGVNIVLVFNTGEKKNVSQPHTSPSERSSCSGAQLHTYQ
jgi:hypothetical protein